MDLALDHIVKRFGKITALADVSLAVPSGARVALIGPNGSGKTTLTRVLMGLVSHEGELSIDGRPARAVRASVARDIAYVPQVAPQVAASVGELTRLVTSSRGVAVADVAAVLARLDLDLDALWRRSFRDLSGGMKQKVLIALALGVRPRLVILDEPTASLDATSRARFGELARELVPDATVILCSHRLDELRTLADRVVALAEGRLTHDGPARGYVADHTQTIVEVRLTPEGTARQEPGRWLGARGFARSSGDWWSAVVGHGDKLRLLPEIVRALDGALDDIVVRDLERVTLGGAS